MDEAPVREGDILAQKYRVDRVLGVGGMGVVVAATHLHLDQRVALKFMLAEAFKDPEALARFQREARAAVKLKSEHVARVLDTGTFDNNSPYIVMEYLEGTDLAGELEKRGALPAGVVAEYIIQACDALAEAHALGIVHRDLKPANLFLTKRADGSPLVKVLDFGISKANSLTEGGLGMTKTASMMGSPLYMSPEQMKSAKDVDARTDVWSLGVIMYELLGGRVPFNSDTLGGLMSQVMMEQPAPLQLIRGDLPIEICELVNRCLEKDPSRRAQNVAVVALGLRPFAPSRAQPIAERIANLLGASPASSTISPTSSVAATHLAPSTSSVVTAPGWGSTGSTASVVVPKSKPVALIAAGGVVLLVGAVIGIARFAHHSSATSDPPHTVATVEAVATTPPMQTTTITTTATPPAAATETAPVIAQAASSAATSPTTQHGHASPTHSAAGKPTTTPVVVTTNPVVTATPTAQPTQKPGMLDTSN